MQPVCKIHLEICKKSRNKEACNLHTLPHNYAIHLLEKGGDLRYIQHILGHNSSKTTEIYTHITQIGLKNIKNPLDDFDL